MYTNNSPRNDYNSNNNTNNSRVDHNNTPNCGDLEGHNHNDSTVRISVVARETWETMGPLRMSTTITRRKVAITTTTTTTAWKAKIMLTILHHCAIYLETTILVRATIMMQCALG